MVKTAQIALTIAAVQAVSVLATPFGMDASDAGIFARTPGRKGRGGSSGQAAKPQTNSQSQYQASNPGPQPPSRGSTFSNVVTPENVNSGLQVANGFLNLVNQNKGYTTPGIMPNSPITPTTPTDPSTMPPSRRDINLERRKGGKGGGGKGGSRSGGGKSGGSGGGGLISEGFNWVNGLFNWNNNNQQQQRREEPTGMMLERRRKQWGGSPSSTSNQQQQVDVSQVVGLTNGVITPLTPQPIEGTVSRREEPQLEALERRRRRGGSRSGSTSSWTSDDRANAISQGSGIITSLTTQSPEEAAGRVDAAVADALKTVKVREEDLDARDFEDDLEARGFDDDFELEARDFDDDFELEARGFDDFDMDELD